MKAGLRGCGVLRRPPRIIPIQKRSHRSKSINWDLTGFNAAASRTAIGLGVNLPQYSVRTTWQYQDNLSHTAGNHGLKFGFDIHRSQLEQLFKPTTRGRLVYTTLNRFVNDVAQIATINKDLAGVAEISESRLARLIFLWAG